MQINNFVLLSSHELWEFTDKLKLWRESVEHAIVIASVW